MQRAIVTKSDGTLGNSKTVDVVEMGSRFGRQGRQRLWVTQRLTENCVVLGVREGTHQKGIWSLKCFYVIITSIFYGKPENSRSLTPSLQADDKGCFRQLIKTKVFQPRLNGYDMKLEVEAKIKEEGTGMYYFLNKCQLSGNLSNSSSILRASWLMHIMKMIDHQSQEIKCLKREGVRAFVCTCITAIKFP